jgi:hypothetical protein
MDAVPNEVLVIGSRFKTELTGWVDSGPGCLRQVRDSVNGNGSQSSSCIPLQFRLVSSGTTTPTAEKRRYPLQVQQSTEDDVDMHAERRGAFFTEHPLLAVSRLNLFFLTLKTLHLCRLSRRRKGGRGGKNS